MGLSTYHGPIFMQYVRMEQLQKKVEIRDTMFGIQTIVVATDELSDAKKPKTL
jgi:dihydroceramidase